jgi:hypothetical protein
MFTTDGRHIKEERQLAKLNTDPLNNPGTSGIPDDTVSRFHFPIDGALDKDSAIAARDEAFKSGTVTVRST